MDYSRTKQQRRGSLSRTLWSGESPTKDLQSSDDRKGVNVQVVLRCRPLNEDELRIGGTNQVITCDEIKQQVMVTQNNSNKQMDTTFVFDKVFGPTSQQAELFEDVMVPVINEVLDGYYWTIFAYGQTGTGKTYTMEGQGRKDKNGQFNKNAGVIPRAVQHIFDILDSQTYNQKPTVKVTFLELCNEEITDLLSLTDESEKQLALMEDRKGFMFVKDMEEVRVYSTNEIYAQLEKGSYKKHTSEKQSKRSHLIFSITIETREYTCDGSELVKCGKLNFVDLAGSENILRSGAREIRAREAGEINKSLLTLGRVINALADNSTHVPYRESKLTRLLRDSLGGKMKTCMIATISPSVLSLEETLGTLDYASRAKRIKNTPEADQKIKKSALLVKLYSQIDTLNQELQTTRENNGIYVSRDEQLSEEITKKQLMVLQELFLSEQQLTVDLRDQLESTKRQLNMARQSFLDLENQYQEAKDTIKEKENIVSNLLRSEKELTERATQLRSDLEDAASDISTLFARIEHKQKLEERNKNHIQNVYSQLALQLQELDESVSASVTNQEQQLKLIQDNIQSSLTLKAEGMEELTKQIEKLKDLYGSGIKHLDDSAEELYRKSQLTLSSLSSELSTTSSDIINLVLTTSSNADKINNGLKDSLNYLGSSISAFLQQVEESNGRTYQTSKSISESLLNFLKNLNVYISKLRLMEEDSQSITNQKLSAFTNKFEEFAIVEERLVLEKIAELLASSTCRKKNLIQATVDDMLESTCTRTKEINQEISDIQTSNADAEETLKAYIKKTEDSYVEDTAEVETRKGTIKDGLQSCITKSTEAAQHSKKTEESLSNVLKENAESFASIIKDVTTSNESIKDHFSSTISSILEETKDASKSIELSVQYPLKLDYEASEQINLLRSHCSEDMREMNNIHSKEVDEISEIARKSLLDDYMVDESSSSTVQRRFNLQSKLVNGYFGDSYMKNQNGEVSSEFLEEDEDAE